jgi:putative translation initiation factor aIF-2 beta subunit
MDYKKLLEKAKKESPKLSEDKGRFEIPLAKGHIQGTKTIITNLQQIADQLDRPIEHILKYLQKELATPAEIKENGSLILNRKISSEEFNLKVKKYADDFVFCKECKKPDTKFKREGDLVSIQCMVCGAKYTKQS